jgi:spore germination protein YaaH
VRTANVWLAAAVAVGLVATPVALGAPSFASAPAPGLVVAAWLPTWDDTAASSLSVALHVGGVTEVSPTWATVRGDGELTLTPPSAPVVLQMAVDHARVVPVVQNYADGAWQGMRMAAILGDPERAAAHRHALVRAAREGRWDGVDIDYEELPPTTGLPFIHFLTALRDDLHADHRSLSVAVPARAGDDDPGTLAYSYQAVGRVADEVRVMTYDHAWSGSAAGPIAPPDWVREVVRYAVARMPRDKMMLGLGTYGYDWVGTTGADIGAVEAEALARRVGAAPRWDVAGGGVTFSYVAPNGQHTVWFEDARSLVAKRQIALDAGLRGIAIWRLGGEDPAVWSAVARTPGASAR